MTIADYKQILALLPDKPGVYMFIDAEGKIIYVGKAKVLKRRVSSYFLKSQSAKTMMMLKKAVDLKHIVVGSEEDALLLENNLIKEYQPRYNILLKDDKTYPWICVKNERFPRVFSTRNQIKDGSLYFGPYTSGLMVKTIIDLIRKLYCLRTCNQTLSESAIKEGKYKVCLEYHLKNCKGPCVGKQTEEDYNEAIVQIKNLLKGNISSVKEHLTSLMKEYAQNMRFEEAQVIKDKIDILSGYQSKSTIVSTTIKNVDVFGVAEDEGNTYVNYLKVVNGAIVQAFTLDMRTRLNEDKESLLGFAITEIRQRVGSDSKEIIVAYKPDILYDDIKYTIPVKGEKLRLLELAERNASVYKFEQRKKKDLGKPKDRTLQNLENMKSVFHLKELPVHIECFDNSNIQGAFPVASCVVFKNCKPSKKDYRHFNIKTVEGPNDFASMEEIIYRRYKRLMDEQQSLPQLIVVDGGKGQLSAAVKSLTKLDLMGKISIIGIAKRLEEIYFPNDPVPLYVDKNSICLKIIQQLRDEAHRFGITFHRDKRSKAMNVSALDGIKGIGPKTRDLLLREAGSVAKIKKMTLDQLSSVIGPSKAQLVFDYFNKQVK